MTKVGTNKSWGGGGPPPGERSIVGVIRLDRLCRQAAWKGASDQELVHPRWHHLAVNGNTVEHPPILCGNKEMNAAIVSSLKTRN